ncbi:MAG: hypothetical protein ACK2UX_05865, partial [Anaerolineae bacterium]
LSEELSVTMDTMSRMLSEYSTMFTVSDSATDPGDDAGAAVSVGRSQAGSPDKAPAVTSADDTGELPVGEATAAAAIATGAVLADATDDISSDLVEDLHTDETVVVSEDDILDALAGRTGEVSEGPAAQSGEGLEMRGRSTLGQEDLDIALSEDLEPDADIAERIPEEDMEVLLAQAEQRVPGTEAEDGGEDSVPAEQPVEPDEIDRLLERDPLEVGLDDLFDSDDMAVLDDEVPAKTKPPADDDEAIAI